MKLKGAIKPTFGPGTGWYRPPAHPPPPGSRADLAARAQAAYRCFVFELRAGGVRLPLAAVAAQRPPACGVLAMDRWTGPGNWHAEALMLPDLKIQVAAMHEATLVRENDGFRQYRGIEWSPGAIERWPQTWLCAPSIEAGLEVLSRMADSRTCNGP